MHYISTSNFFLWHGLKCLLEPYETCWLNDGLNTELIINGVDGGDVFIIDATKDSAPLISYLSNKKVYPRFVFLNNFDDNTLNILFGASDRLNLKRSLNYYRYFILGKPDKKHADFVPLSRLSPREAMIMNLSLDGLGVRKIAVTLGITAKTVYALRARACRKFGADKVSELIPYKALVHLRTSEIQSRHVRESAPVL